MKKYTYFLLLLSCFYHSFNFCTDDETRVYLLSENTVVEKRIELILLRAQKTMKELEAKELEAVIKQQEEKKPRS